MLSEYLDDFVTTFIDNILIYSEIIEEYIKYIKKVL